MRMRVSYCKVRRSSEREEVRRCFFIKFVAYPKLLKLLTRFHGFISVFRVLVASAVELYEAWGGNVGQPSWVDKCGTPTSRGSD
jgi:hypothetical protein